MKHYWPAVECYRWQQTTASTDARQHH